MAQSFEDYQAQLLLRHTNGTTRTLSTLGDVIMVGGLAAGALTKRAPVAVMGVTAGFAIAATAHLFQPGTLRDEIASIIRHPIWAVMAESQRVFGQAAYRIRAVLAH